MSRNGTTTHNKAFADMKLVASKTPACDLADRGFAAVALSARLDTGDKHVLSGTGIIGGVTTLTAHRLVLGMIEGALG